MKYTLLTPEGRQEIELGEQDFSDYLSQLETERGLKPGVLSRMSYVESHGNSRAVSPKGAEGEFQLMPATAQRFNVKDPFDRREAARGAADYMKFLVALFKGDYKLAHAAYNAGEGAVLKHGGVPPFKETQNYVKQFDTEPKEPTKEWKVLNAPTKEWKILNPSVGDFSEREPTDEEDLSTYERITAPSRRLGEFLTDKLQENYPKKTYEPGKGEMRAVPPPASTGWLMHGIAGGLLEPISGFYRALGDVTGSELLSALGEAVGRKAKIVGTPTGVLPDEGPERVMHDIGASAPQTAAALGANLAFPGSYGAMNLPGKIGLLSKRALGYTPILSQEYGGMREQGATPIAAGLAGLTNAGIEALSMGSGLGAARILGKVYGPAGAAAGYMAGSTPPEVFEDILQMYPEALATGKPLPGMKDIKEQIERSWPVAFSLGALGAPGVGAMVGSQKAPTIQDIRREFGRQMTPDVAEQVARASIPTQTFQADVKPSTYIGNADLMRLIEPQQLQPAPQATRVAPQAEIEGGIDLSKYPGVSPQAPVTSLGETPQPRKFRLLNPQPDELDIQEPADPVTEVNKIVDQAPVYGALPKTWTRVLERKLPDNPIVPQIREKLAALPPGKIVKPEEFRSLIPQVAPQIEQIEALPLRPRATAPLQSAAPQDIAGAAPTAASRFAGLVNQASPEALAGAQARIGELANKLAARMGSMEPSGMVLPDLAEPIGTGVTPDTIEPRITGAPVEPIAAQTAPNAEIQRSINDVIAKGTPGQLSQVVSARGAGRVRNISLYVPTETERANIGSVFDEALTRGLPRVTINKIGSLYVGKGFPKQSNAFVSPQTGRLAISSGILKNLESPRRRDAALSTVFHEMNHLMTIDAQGNSLVKASPHFSIDPTGVIIDPKVPSGIRMIPEKVGPLVREYHQALEQAIESGDKDAQAFFSYPLMDLKNRGIRDLDTVKAEIFAQDYSLWHRRPRWMAQNMPETARVMEQIYGLRDLPDVGQFDAGVHTALQGTSTQALPDNEVNRRADQWPAEGDYFQEAPDRGGNIYSYNQQLALKFADSISIGLGQKGEDLTKVLSEGSNELWEILKRFKVGHSDTLKMGKDLAAALGHDPEEIIRIIKETGLPGATVLAAAEATSRVLIINMMSGKKTTRQFARGFADIMNVMAHARAHLSEAGRELGFHAWVMKNADRIGTEVFWAKKAADQLKNLPKKKGEEIREWTENEVIRLMGGESEMAKVVNKIRKDEKHRDHQLVLRFLAHQQARENDTFEGKRAVVELIKANFLNGFQTWQYNLASSVSSVMVNEGWVRPVSGLISKLPGIGSGEQETNHIRAVKGLGNLLNDMWAAARITAMRENPAAELKAILDMPPDSDIRELLAYFGGSKWDTTSKIGIAGDVSFGKLGKVNLDKPGKIIRHLSFTPMAIGDAMLKVVPYRMELNRLRLEGVEEAEAKQRAIEWANHVLFNDPLEGFTAMITKLVHDQPFLTPLVPFARAIVNGTKMSLSLTPGVNLAQPSLWQGKSRARDDAIAKVLGSFVLGALVFGFQELFDSEDDPRYLQVGPLEYRKKLMWERRNVDLAVPFFSYLVSLERLDPLSTPIAAISFAIRKIKAGKWDDSDTKELGKFIVKYGADKYFLSSAAKFVSDVWQGDIFKALKSYAKSTAVGLVPLSSLLSNTAEIFDSVQREDDKEILANLQRRLPYFRNLLEPKIDVMGEALPQRKGFFPFSAIRKDSGDATDRRLAELGQSFDIPKWLRDLPADYQQVILQDRKVFLRNALRAPRGSEVKALDSARERWGQKWAWLRKPGVKLPPLSSVKARAGRL